jgi:tetrahydromethanopterin S-methyltransferase subunit G
VLQQSQKIRDLARDPNNRQEVAKRLEKLDEGMHRVFAEVGEWTNDPKETANKEIENLKRDFGVLGNAVHYLMTDVGVQHRDDDGDGDEPAAPLPKPKSKLSLPAPPSKDADQ